MIMWAECDYFRFLSTLAAPIDSCIDATRTTASRIFSVTSRDFKLAEFSLKKIKFVHVLLITG